MLLIKNIFQKSHFHDRSLSLAFDDFKTGHRYVYPANDFCITLLVCLFWGVIFKIIFLFNRKKPCPYVLFSTCNFYVVNDMVYI